MPSKLFGSQGPAKPHLVQGKTGVAGEVDDLRRDTEAAFTKLEADGGLQRTDEFVDPAAADPDYLMTARASAAAPEVWTNATAEATAAWQADTEMVPPRNITVTGNASVDIEAGTLDLVGFVRDENGDLVAQTEQIVITDNLATTLAGLKPFSLLTSASMSAHAGVGGTFTLGFGDLIGLSALIKPRAGLIAPTREIEAGVVVTTGTFANESGSPVTSYTPATVPDASNDYAVTYEAA